MKLMLAFAAVAVSGCGLGELSLHDGASQVFVRDATCPAERVKVTPRPDIAPHTVLPPAPVAAPPAEIAADPERLRLWQSQQPPQPNLDAIGATFEVAGCNTTTLYVCAHPRDDGGQGPFSADIGHELHVTLYTDHHADSPHATAVSDHVVRSSVVCLPGNAPAQ